MRRSIIKAILGFSLAAVASIALPCIAEAQSLNPLYQASAYSLAVHPGGRDRDRYVPLGVLFPRDRDELTSYGFDFTEQAVSPLVDPNRGMLAQDWFVVRHDRPTPPSDDPNGLGLFAASWAWHMMPMGEEIPGYGTFTKDRSYFDPKVRRFLIDSDAALAKTYGVSPRVVMWSLDNEWEGGLDYTPAAVSGFDDWLKGSYKTISALNKAWGTSYQTWSDVVPPKDEAVISRPAAWLDWHAYQDGYFTQMTADRYKAMYEADPRHRAIAQKTTQQSYDSPTVGKERALDPALLCDLTRPYGGWYGADIYDADDSYAYQVNFAAQCIRPLVDSGLDTGKLFLTETNNHGGPGWQFANSIWRSLGNGVKAYDFFCFGMAGATDDSDIYGITSPNTLLRGKAPYAVRFAYAVRRTEDFWARSKPARSVPRIAILLNRQDMLLDDNVPGQMWAGPLDSRETVYAALRAAGYWVDVIPYTKLDSAYLKQYSALLLVNGDHLTSGECSQVGDYVKQGGVLVADSLAGYYDEHHQVTQGLEPVTGVHIASFQTGANAMAKVAVQSARVLAKTAGGDPLTVENAYGRGSVVYVATDLGKQNGRSDDAYRKDLTDLLSDAHVAPAYVETDTTASTPSLRVEQPFVAGDNMAMVVANIKETGHEAATLRMSLPAGRWLHALWAPAESEVLQPVNVEALSNGQYRVSLPAFATAGMLLFFNRHEPLISASVAPTAKTGIDGALPALTPGAPTIIKTALYNTSPSAAPAGLLKVRVLQGWTVTPSVIRTPRLAPNGVFHAEVRVTPPSTDVLPYTERMYPINFRWSSGQSDKAVTTTPVGVAIDNSKCPYLLTDNTTYPSDFPRKITTGATYRYLLPAGDEVADPAAGNSPADTALISGYGRWLMDSESAHFKLSPPNIASIEFDLKAVYPLHEVRLLSSDFGGFPTKMTVSVSSDGVTFHPVGSASPEGAPGSGKWLTLRGLDTFSARYVKLDVTLQQGGGNIDEVEIWSAHSAVLHAPT